MILLVKIAKKTYQVSIVSNKRIGRENNVREDGEGCGCHEVEMKEEGRMVGAFFCGRSCYVPDRVAGKEDGVVVR